METNGYNGWKLREDSGFIVLELIYYGDLLLYIKKMKITVTKLDVNIYFKKVIRLRILKRKQTVQMWKSRKYNTISN